MKLFIVAIIAFLFIGCHLPGSKESSRDLNLIDIQERNLREKYLGKSKSELQAIFGPKVAGQVENDNWEIRDDIGPGFHSFVWCTQVRFKSNVAVGIKRDIKSVGCIQVNPSIE